MNTRITSVLLVALIITGTCFTSQAFAASITVETDSDVYDHSSLITITGTVDPVDTNEVPVIIMVIAPNGNIAYVDQISLNSDGTFSAEISTAGNLMKDNGTYQIQVSYSAVDATTSVELTTTTATAATTGTVGTAETGESIIESAITSGQISYDITCGTVSHFWVNGDDDNVTVIVDGTDDGILTITLHEEIIKPFDDGDFFVMVNGEEIDFIQNGNNLIIPCEAGTERIEIYGSWAIPEFGVIAAVILAVAIASIIAVSAKSRLTLVPKN